MSENVPIGLTINGYKIFYIPTYKNITSIHSYVSVGSLYESAKESGISHLVEHILLDSWIKCSGSCTKYWSKKGIISNAQTQIHYTKYYIVGTSTKSEDMYDYMASVMTNPKITEKGITSAKKAVKDELLILLNNPNWKIDDVFYKSISDNTKLKGFSRIADINIKIKNLSTITLKNVTDFYNKWYKSNNMFFCIVSNEPLHKVETLLKKYLVPRPIGPKPSPVHIKCHKCTSLIHRPDAQKTSYTIGFLNNTVKKDDFIYINLIQDMLIGDVSSLLYLVLRDKLGLIYNIKLNYQNTQSYILSTFEVSCTFENSKKLYSELIRLLKQFTSGKFHANLLTRSKERLIIVDTNSCKDNTEYLQNFYTNQYVLTGKTDVTPHKAIQKIKTVTKPKLLEIARRLFDFNTMLVVCETK